MLLLNKIICIFFIAVLFFLMVFIYDCMLKTKDNKMVAAAV